MTDQQLIEKARKQYESEGYVEFDDTPAISMPPDDGGAYVQAWVWVEYDEEKEEDDE